MRRSEKKSIEIVLLVIRLTVHYVVTRRASVGRSAVATSTLVRGRAFHRHLHPVPNYHTRVIPSNLISPSSSSTIIASSVNRSVNEK